MFTFTSCINLLKSATLFDVTQQCNSSHDPMSRPYVTLKVNRSNVINFCSSWFSVNWTLIQLAVLSYK